MTKNRPEIKEHRVRKRNTRIVCLITKTKDELRQSEHIRMKFYYLKQERVCKRSARSSEMRRKAESAHAHDKNAYLEKRNASIDAL
jgi:hypothetical protein